MKATTLILSLIFIHESFSIFAQNVESETSKTGTIYILRSTGLFGSAGAFSTFIDGNLTCRINNNKYSIHEVPAGTHQFSIQFYGRKEKNKNAKIDVNVGRGETIYLSVVQIIGLYFNSIVYCDEITEETAKRKLIELNKDDKCH